MDIYIIDTSSLIEMKDKYPVDVSLFKPVWKKVEEVCQEGRLIAPVQVLKEIEQVDDELKRWAKSKRKIFIKPYKSQCDKVLEILSRFPFLANLKNLVTLQILG